jgi:hypothetical protein
MGNTKPSVPCHCGIVVGTTLFELTNYLGKHIEKKKKFVNLFILKNQLIIKVFSAKGWWLNTIESLPSNVQSLGYTGGGGWGKGRGLNNLLNWKKKIFEKKKIFLWRRRGGGGGGGGV